MPEPVIQLDRGKCPNPPTARSGDVPKPLLQLDRGKCPNPSYNSIRGSARTPPTSRSGEVPEPVIQLNRGTCPNPSYSSIGGRAQTPPTAQLVALSTTSEFVHFQERNPIWKIQDWRAPTQVLPPGRRVSLFLIDGKISDLWL